MTYRVDVSARARRNLNEILDWILDHYPTEAEEWMLGLERSIASLETFPKRCPPSREGTTSSGEVREMIYGKRRGRYRILFRIAGDRVEVISVAHGARNR